LPSHVLLQNSFYSDSLKLAGVRDILDVETKYEYVVVYIRVIKNRLKSTVWRQCIVGKIVKENFSIFSPT